MLDLVTRAERFARLRHADQFRKGKTKEPYIVHLEEVALLVKKWRGSDETIAAAWLHDTVEDCPPTSIEELKLQFGTKVAGYVEELTDDKSLKKEKRKLLQISNASKKTPEAALIKLADKSSNILSIANSPPLGWSLQRRLEYIKWARTVVGELPRVISLAYNEFENRCDIAELQSYIELGSLRQAQNASLTIMERKAMRAGASQEQTDKFLRNLLQDSFKLEK